MELSDALSRIATLESEKQSIKEKLETEGFKARETKRELQAQLDRATARVTELEGSVPKEGQAVLSKTDAERYATYQALGKPDEVKASLEQAARDRQAVLTQGNRDALATLGLKPSALRLREFDAVTVTATKEGDTIKATVKDGDAETPWEQWVKDKGLEGDLKDFGLTQTVTVVPALAQVGNTQRTDRLSTPEEIAESQKNDPKYSI